MRADVTKSCCNAGQGRGESLFIRVCSRLFSYEIYTPWISDTWPVGYSCLLVNCLLHLSLFSEYTLHILFSVNTHLDVVQHIEYI